MSSPQAEAAALIAEARAHGVHRIADAYESALAALAVKREADREAVLEALLDARQNWAGDDDDPGFLGHMADAALSVIREAPPTAEIPGFEGTHEALDGLTIRPDTTKED